MTRRPGEPCIHGLPADRYPTCRKTEASGRPAPCSHGFPPSSCPHCPGGRLAYLDDYPGAHERGRSRSPHREDNTR